MKARESLIPWEYKWLVQEAEYEFKGLTFIMDVNHGQHQITVFIQRILSSSPVFNLEPYLVAAIIQSRAANDFLPLCLLAPSDLSRQPLEAHSSRMLCETL